MNKAQRLTVRQRLQTVPPTQLVEWAGDPDHEVRAMAKDEQKRRADEQASMQSMTGVVKPL